MEARARARQMWRLAEAAGKPLRRGGWRSIGSPAEGFVQRLVHASYLHLHWAGPPSTAARLVDAASGQSLRRH